MTPGAMFELLRGLAGLAENFPDDPRLGRKLLFSGALLVCTIFAPTDSAEWGILILVSKSLCVITGGVLLVLGGFVFLRRWVWSRQDKRAAAITTLKLK